MTKRKAKPGFAVGDAVFLKGQAHVFTVSLPPDGAIQKDGWTWVIQSHDRGVMFSLAPTACLVKAATVGEGSSGL